MMKFSFFLLFFTAFPSWAIENLMLNNFKIQVKKNVERDEVVSLKGDKVISRYPLLRESAAPKVIDMRVIDSVERVFIVDYYKGSSGTANMTECFEIWLFQLDGKGQLRALEHKEYRCDVISDNPQMSDTSFNYAYKIEKIGKQYLLKLNPHK